MTSTPSIKETISAHDEGEDLPRMEGEREAFEADAAPMGFDLKRFECLAPEPWSEYADESTGHRWGGWLARATSTRESDPLTIAKISDCARGAQIDFCMDKESSFEVAFARRIEKVRSALSAAPQSDGWISVDERLPAHEQEVICTGFEGNNPAKKRWQEFAVFHSDGTFHHHEEGAELYPPTHWRETFALPTTQTQGQSHG